MSLFLKKLLLSVILFLSLNFLYFEILLNVDFNFIKINESSKFENNDFNVLALGTSLVLDGIDSQLLSDQGYSAYNFGVGGSSLKTNWYQLNKYLEKNAIPQYLILGLGSCLNNNYSSLNRLKNEFIHPVVRYLYEGPKPSVYELPMIKFKWLATENLKKLVSKQHREAKLVLGQLRIRRKVPDQTKYRAKLKQEITFDDYKGAKYMFKIDSICKSNNIKLVIVEMPGYKNTRNEVPVGPNLITNKDDSLYIYNLNNKILCDSLFDPENDWLGNSHLNQYGAKKLTKYIYKNVLLD